MDTDSLALAVKLYAQARTAAALACGVFYDHFADLAMELKDEGDKAFAEFLASRSL